MDQISERGGGAGHGYSEGESRFSYGAGSLCDLDIARLQAQFVLPLVVKDMLDDIELIDETAEFTLQDMLASHRAPEALLCIALCARQLGARLQKLVMSAALEVEAVCTINAYGPLLLLCAEKSGDAAMIAAGEDVLAEDFEALADLLDATAAELDDPHQPAGILLDIFAMQARAWQDQIEAESAFSDLGPAAPSLTALNRMQSYGGNVVPLFPHRAA